MPALLARVFDGGVGLHLVFGNLLHVATEFGAQGAGECGGFGVRGYGVGGGVCDQRGSSQFPRVSVGGRRGTPVQK